MPAFSAKEAGGGDENVLPGIEQEAGNALLGWTHPVQMAAAACRTLRIGPPAAVASHEFLARPQRGMGLAGTADLPPSIIGQNPTGWPRAAITSPSNGSRSGSSRRTRSLVGKLENGVTSRSASKR